MSIINKTIIFFFSIFIFSVTYVSAEELKKIGKSKDWETLVLIKDNELTCFAQTKPVLQSPKVNKREARLFVSFRPNDKVADEISTTSGYEFNSQNSIYSEGMIHESTADVCMGHLEVAGFEMMRGLVNENGINKSMFRKFDSVFSGHFHVAKSERIWPTEIFGRFFLSCK